MTLDLKVTEIYLTASILVNPCEFVMEITFGEWSLNITLIDYDWGTERQLSFGNAVEFR